MNDQSEDRVIPTIAAIGTALVLALIVGMFVAALASSPKAEAVVVVLSGQSTVQLYSPGTSAPICHVASTVDKDIWRGGAYTGCAGTLTATAFSYIGGQIGSDQFGPGNPGYVNPPSYVDIYRVRVKVQNKYGWYRIYDHYADGRVVKVGGNG